MADTHLAEVAAITGTFDAIVVGTAGETVPHRFYVGRDSGCRPVGIAVVRDHAAQVLEFFILIFHRGLQPIVAVKIHYDTALVESPVALAEVGLYHETEVLFIGLHLEYRCVVVAEMVIGTLPQVGMGSSRYRQTVPRNGICHRLPCPLHLVQGYIFSTGQN